MEGKQRGENKIVSESEFRHPTTVENASQVNKKKKYKILGGDKKSYVLVAIIFVAGRLYNIIFITIF